LEAQNLAVVGAFLCPSSDSYVRSKLGADAISLDDRNRLAELAVRDSDWIDVYHAGIAKYEHEISCVTT
jgi:hypothetical protein